MSARILSRSDDHALNCFTGSFVALGDARGALVTEQQLFENGDCFLFQAGRDETGLPEYIFPVEEAGVLGMERMGAVVHTAPIAPAGSGDRPWRQLADLLGRHGEVIAWVNTRHLAYAGVYLRTPPYLHSVLVRSVDGDTGSVRLFDCMVADAERYSCEAELGWADFENALRDWIRSDAHDCMGRFYTADTTRLGSPAEARTRLTDQAGRFAAEPRFRDAVSDYARLNAECLSAGDARARVAGRRLFDHSTVLYAVPSLSLMRRSMDGLADLHEARVLIDEAIRHWRAIGVLGLRFEATGSPTVVERLAVRFDDVDAVTRQLWERLA